MKKLKSSFKAKKTRRMFFYLTLFLVFMLGICGCDNNSDEEYSNLLLGKWEMELSNNYEISPGESIFEFQNDGILTVDSKSEFINDSYLLPSGTYHYSLNKDIITFSSNNLEFCYKITGGKLILSFSPKEMQDNAYPMFLQYTFHKK